MKHFISFLKRKGLAIEANADSTVDNAGLVHQINHELMTYGYVLDQILFERLVKCETSVLNEVYSDLAKGLKAVAGGDGYEPIYRNFPQSVVNMSYYEFVVNALMHYWSAGTWRPEDAEYLNREFALEPVDYKNVSLISNEQYESIFTDIITSSASISATDKAIIDYFLDGGTGMNFSDIKFKEIAAYIGKRLLTLTNSNKLPTKDATDVLRIYSAFSGGDEGLKEDTKFKNPTARQRRMLLNTLNECYNLEESFKTYREKWLRVLYYLHPLDARNVKRYPQVAQYADDLRNTPKRLRTFNSRVEELIKNEDIAVLDLLKRKRGVFTRRLDHMVRLFGVQAFQTWLSTNPTFSQLITAYNHFTDRDKKQAGRAVVLAGQSASNVTTFDAQEPLDAKVVALIKDEVLDALNQRALTSPLANKKVFINRALYFRPLGVNNRASSLSLDGAVNGTTEVVPEGKTIRMYVHWHGRSDIDLSGFIIGNDNSVTKVGWNGRHSLGQSVVYSGDNTGYSDKNAEYLDVTPESLPANAEWVIADAVIYSGPSTFADYSPKTRVGWMLRSKPEANETWTPETVEHAAVLNTQARRAYLMALHVPTRSIVYLDLAMGNNNVTTEDDAIKMRMYLENFVSLDDGSTDVKWDKINQGHVLNLMASEIVDTVEDADIKFDENTTYEKVMSLL